VHGEQPLALADGVVGECHWLLGMSRRQPRQSRQDLFEGEIRCRGLGVVEEAVLPWIDESDEFPGSRRLRERAVAQQLVDAEIGDQGADSLSGVDAL
jgi:hypothetical protein